MPTLLRSRSVTSENVVDFLRWAIDRAREDTAFSECAHTVRLEKLHIRLLTRNTHYAELVRRRLYCGHAGTEACEEITAAVLSPEDSSMPPPPAWGEPIFHPRQFEKRLEGTPFRATYFHDCRLWQIYDHQQKFCLQWMAGSRSYPAWEPGAPLRVFLHWAYRFQGLRLAHAGTLGKGGAGVLLVGRGGSGKSSTVVGGVARGLESVGDDYVLIEQSPDAVTAYPLYPTFKQDRRGLARLGLEEAIAPGRAANWQEKFEFGCREISGRPLADRLRIGAILIPTIAEVPHSIIRPIPKNRAMLALAPTGLFQMPGERDSGVRFYSDLVRRVPCFALMLSRNPADVSSVLEKFIDGGFQCV